MPFTGVYQRLSNPYVDEETRKIRAFLYEAGLLPKTPVTARALLRSVKSGGCPAFVADLRDDRGAPVPFFGHPARSNVFPALLARTTGLPLYAGAAYRLPGVRFRIGAREFRFPRRTTARPTRSPGPRRCRRSSRLSSAKRPSNGCGRTGSGIDSGSPPGAASPSGARGRFCRLPQSPKMGSIRRGVGGTRRGFRARSRISQVRRCRRSGVSKGRRFEGQAFSKDRHGSADLPDRSHQAVALRRRRLRHPMAALDDPLEQPREPLRPLAECADGRALGPDVDIDDRSL